MRRAGAGGVLGGGEGGSVVEGPAAKGAVDAKSVAVGGAAVEGATMVRRNGQHRQARGSIDKCMGLH